MVTASPAIKRELHRSQPSRSPVLLLLGLIFFAAGVQLVAPRTYPPPRLGAQQSVQTRNPKLGIHTRLSGTEDEAALSEQLGQVREMGARWIVDLFPWAYVQPRGPSAFDWRGADLMVAHARRQGLNIIARLDIVPEWARDKQTTDRRIDPAYYDEFAHYAAAFARRYRDDVQYIVIWNEPNLDFEWGSRPPDPGAYAALLKVVYPAVKQANPTMQLAVGALSPGPAVPGIRMDDLEYLRGMLDADVPFDALAVHNYGGKEPPDAEPHPERVNFRRIEVYRETLRQAGHAKPMLITEGGWNDHPRWAGAVTPAQRLRWTVEAYRLSEQWPDVIAVCFWQFRGPLTHGYQDNFSFVAPDGTPKAIYWAVREYATERTEAQAHVPH